MKAPRFNLKRHKNLQLELDRAVSVLRQKYNPEKIIVFGSFAQKKTQRWSDLDLAIIKDTKKRFIDRLKEVAFLVGPGLATDFLVYTPKEFKQMTEENYFVRDEILAKGMVIYDKNRPIQLA